MIRLRRFSLITAALIALLAGAACQKGGGAGSDASGVVTKAVPDGPDHFRISGYASILYVDILIENADQREIVRSALREIHVPGAETPEGFRVFGYLRDGQVVDYL